MASARILIADDDTAIVQTMTWVLKEHGYDVVAAHQGARVLELMEERTPDLVLLDVMFPDADGYQILERIKGDDRWRDVPVLMVSSLPPEEAAVRTLGLGAADFVKKPFRVKELLARIQAQLRMRAILRSANDTLRHVEAELERVREEAENRRKLVDILHDVTDDLSSDEIYHLLARRVARALDLTHCSVILARVGERPPRGGDRLRAGLGAQLRARPRSVSRDSGGARYRASGAGRGCDDLAAVRRRAPALGARRDDGDHAFGHRVALCPRPDAGRRLLPAPRAQRTQADPRGHRVRRHRGEGGGGGGAARQGAGDDDGRQPSPRGARAHRPAHRGAQPPCPHGASQLGAGARQALRDAGVAAADRHRPLQAW
jgi:DNA-binding response OmpR family regulator